jgi:hypothetical protein
MTRRKRVRDPLGRIWTVVKVRRKDAEEEDFRFWHDGLTPEQRVEAVADALESCLKTRGVHAIPRLRRVHRRIQCPWRAVPRDRGARRRISRAAARNEATTRAQDRADAGVLRRAAAAKGTPARSRKPRGKPQD